MGFFSSSFSRFGFYRPSTPSSIPPLAGVVDRFQQAKWVRETQRAGQNCIEKMTESWTIIVGYLGGEKDGKRNRSGGKNEAGCPRCQMDGDRLKVTVQCLPFSLAHIVQNSSTTFSPDTKWLYGQGDSRSGGGHEDNRFLSFTQEFTLTRQSAYTEEEEEEKKD